MQLVARSQSRSDTNYHVLVLHRMIRVGLHVVKVGQYLSVPLITIWCYCGELLIPHYIDITIRIVPVAMLLTTVISRTPAHKVCYLVIRSWTTASKSLSTSCHSCMHLCFQMLNFSLWNFSQHTHTHRTQFLLLVFYIWPICVLLSMANYDVLYSRCTNILVI